MTILVFDNEAILASLHAQALALGDGSDDCNELMSFVTTNPPFDIGDLLNKIAHIRKANMLAQGSQ
jgi:hypothetical protein